VKYLSVCSGIEAASVAWHPLGWECVGVAEIEKFPSAVLAHHYPNVPNFGDLTRYQEWPSDLAPDLIVGGTPCQSFSVAGLRAGLADPRGNLALVFLGLVDKYRPRYVVWENVPGVRSSGGGRDFGAFLGALGELGYGWAYRSLDAQYFGLAQRRERVFVVGCLGDWRAPAAVLLESEGLRGHPAPRREARQGVAPDVGAGAGCRSYRWQNNSAGIIEDAVAATLRRESATTDERSVPAYTLVPALANPLTARMHKGVNTTCDEGQTMIAHALRPEGFDASEDGTGRGTPLVAVAFDTYNLSVSKDGTTQTLSSSATDVNHIGAVAFAENTRGELRTADVMTALSSGGGKPGQGYPAVMYGIDCEHNVSGCGDAIGPLMKDSPSGGGKPLPAVEFVHQGGGTQTTLGYDPASETTPTLPKSQTLAVAFSLGSHASAAGGDQTNRSHAGGGPVGLGVSENLSYSLRGGRTQAIASIHTHAMAVRRLTPRECERLQGFPDDYTLIPYRNGLSADGPRYKALGNSMAVPVMAWIGRRIAEVDALLVDLERQEAA